MKKYVFFAVVTLASSCWTSSAIAALLVHDTWQDGNRNQPDAPATTLITYAENDGSVAVDADFDSDLESRWFRGGTGTLDPVGLGGPLRADIAGTSSASWTTYFTDAEGNEAELVNVGDKLSIKWVFTLSGVNASNGSQALRLAVVDSPARLTGNNSPSSGTYTGYALFGNMGQTFNHSRPWDLMTRASNPADLLSASAAWLTAGVQDGTNGNPGYADDVEYTFTFVAELLAGNDLRITMRMDGTGLDGAGKNYLESVFVDTNPASLKFDTFALRPSQAVQTATRWDTSLFEVELIPIPEPASLTLWVFSIAAIGKRRRR